MKSLVTRSRLAAAASVVGEQLVRSWARGRTVSAIWGLSLLLAVPVMGSRVEDATLRPEIRDRLIMSQVQGSNPALRNHTLDARIAFAPVATTSGILLHGGSVDLDALLALAEAAAEVETAVGPDIQVVVHNATEADPRPQRRPTMTGNLSTSGVIAAPAALGAFSDVAPIRSRTPETRPDGFERRVVRYDTAWLRRIDLRPLSADEQCLTTAIYHEARGESLKGQFAVAEVIMNRVASRNFPNSICGVVYQGVRAGQVGGCQFSFACDGRSEAMPNRTAANRAQRIAQVMANGGHRGLTGGAQFFHTHAVSPSWSRRFQQTTQIGAHIFYRG